MEEMKQRNIDKRIDGSKAIYDYTHCAKLASCEECECHKQIDEIKEFSNLCEFIRTYTSFARAKIEVTLNETL